MKFKTKVIHIGKYVNDFYKENIIVLFGETAPYDLKDYSVIIEKPQSPTDIEAGDKLYLSSQEYLITAVGKTVNESLFSLGHCTLRFDGAIHASLPGSLHLRGSIPNIRVGDKIIVF